MRKNIIATKRCFGCFNNGLTLCNGTYSVPRYSANPLWSKTKQETSDRVGIIFRFRQNRPGTDHPQHRQDRRIRAGRGLILRRSGNPLV